MFRKIISLFLIISFIASFAMPASYAEAGTLLSLPKPGTMVALSDAYQALLLRGVTVHQENPFLFDFIVDSGQDKLAGTALKAEGERLIKYFLAALAIPEKELWVNLSPYEKDRIVPQALGQTDLGRDLLAQDYILKQVAASLLYPEKGLGREFWDRVYSKLYTHQGNDKVAMQSLKNVLVDAGMFNKVWIMADKAEVYEKGQSAFVVNCHLKVMLEEDYLAKSKMRAGDAKAEPFSARSASEDGGGAAAAGPAHRNRALSPILREFILPELEKEVNEGKNFSNLRQICHSIILASWFKKNLKQALLNQVYSDTSKTKGIPASLTTLPLTPDQIYDRYLQAYKKGVFNYIKETPQANGTTVPRKYFSGGFVNSAQMADPTVVSNLSRRSLLGRGLLTMFTVGVTVNPISQEAMHAADVEFFMRGMRLPSSDKSDQGKKAFRSQIGEHIFGLLGNNARYFNVYLLIDYNTGEYLVNLSPKPGTTLEKNLKDVPAPSALRQIIRPDGGIIRYTVAAGKKGPLDFMNRDTKLSDVESTIASAVLGAVLIGLGLWDWRQEKKRNKDSAMNTNPDLRIMPEGQADQKLPEIGSVWRREIDGALFTVGAVVRTSGPEKYKVLMRNKKTIVPLDDFLSSYAPYVEDIKSTKSVGSHKEKKQLPALSALVAAIAQIIEDGVLTPKQLKSIPESSVKSFLTGKHKPRLEWMKNLLNSLSEERREKILDLYVEQYLEETNNPSPSALSRLLIRTRLLRGWSVVEASEDNRSVVTDAEKGKKLTQGNISFFKRKYEIDENTLKYLNDNPQSAAMTVGQVAEYLYSLTGELAVADEVFNNRKGTDGRKISYVDDFDHGPIHAADLLEKAVSLAGAIGKYDQVDWQVLSAAIALHDIFAYENIDHGPQAMAFAQRFLQGQLSDDQIKKVVEAIRLHDVRTEGGMAERAIAGIEAQILYDVDQMEAFGHKGIYRFIAVYTRRMESLESIKSKVPINAQSRYDTLSFLQSKQMADEDNNYPALKAFFDDLHKGHAGAEWVAQFIQAHEMEHPLIIVQKALEQLSSSRLPEADQGYARGFFMKLEEDYRQESLFTKTLAKLIHVPDAAMTDAKGGIDFNTQETQIIARIEGPGPQMKVDPAMIERLRREGISSLSFKIISMTPVANLTPLIGP